MEYILQIIKDWLSGMTEPWANMDGKPEQSGNVNT